MRHYVAAALGTNPIADEHGVVESNGDCAAEISAEEESLYAHRYEEKYDLCDPKYEAWLAVHHPEAVHQIFNKENETSYFIDSTPKHPCQSISNVPKALNADKQNTTPNSSTEKPTEHSPFSDLLNSQEVLISPPKPKTAKAQVLTSIECIRILKEKQEKKQREAEEKESGKKEREAKKLLKEVEKQRKAEEKAKAALQKSKKASSKNKSTEKVTKEPTTVKVTKEPTKRKADSEVRSSRKS